MSAQDQWALLDRHRKMIADLTDYEAHMAAYEKLPDAGENTSATSGILIARMHLPAFRQFVSVAAHTLDLTAPPRPSPEETP